MRVVRRTITLLLVLLIAASPILCVCRSVSASTANASCQVRACCRGKTAGLPSRSPACPHCQQKDNAFVPAADDASVPPSALVSLPALTSLFTIAPNQITRPPLLPGDSPPTLLSLHVAFRC